MHSLEDAFRPGVTHYQDTLRTGCPVRVSDVLELLANGAAMEEIVADYLCLKRDDILAAIAYAAQQTNHVVVEIA